MKKPLILTGLAALALSAAVAVPASADDRCDRDGRYYRSSSRYINARDYGRDRYYSRRDTQHDRFHRRLEDKHDRAHDRGFDSRREHARWHNRAEDRHDRVHDRLSDRYRRDRYTRYR